MVSFVDCPFGDLRIKYVYGVSYAVLFFFQIIKTEEKVSMMIMHTM